MPSLFRRVFAGTAAAAALLAGLSLTPFGPEPSAAQAVTSYSQVDCGDSAARLFQLRDDGNELWYSSISGPASSSPAVYNWRKVYTFGTSRPALAVAAHSVVNGVVKLFVTDRDGGLRVYNFSTSETAVTSVNNLHTGSAANPGPYNFSRLASDGRRLYGTKGGELFIMTGIKTTARPNQLATVKTIGYPLALWGVADNDQELLYTDTSGVLRSVDVGTTSSGSLTATVAVVRSDGWNQAAIASPGAGLLIRDTTNNLWRHLVDLPAKGTDTVISAHQTISTSVSTPDLPITTPPDICSPINTSNVVAIARGQLGTEEGPDADKYLAWAWPGLHTTSTSWCAGFTSWVTNHQAGVTTFKNLAVQNWVIAARAGNNGLHQVSTPQSGDLIAFDWDGNGDFAPGNAHIGIVDRVGSDGSIHTIEGNAEGNDGTDAVTRNVHPRSTSYSQLYIRIG
ncbi:CHAP domain-containing protein [Kribbella sp. NPDC056861]|uniref:CHAP domain-containing protein n=1 Tax=Kribbella sp. NPDC056861 TaxID=3154857 RepID=UPI003437E62E